MQALLALWQAVAAGAWREAPGRVLLTVAGIACGVALGAAVHLINTTAREEFEAAARALAGIADVVVRGPRQGFDEQIYPRVAQVPGVAAASPAVELEATLADVRDSIKVIGLDPFRAALVQPALVAHASSEVLDLLDGDAVWITQTAADRLGLARGSKLRIRVGTDTVEFSVVGIVPHDAYAAAAAIADIATLQWRLAQLGRLQRIDLRLTPGADIARVSRDIQALLPPDVTLSRPAVEASRASAMTRAYRLNLDMLALVALVTGAFLVFSTQFLALMRRRTQFALIRVLGVTRGALTRMLLAEGVMLGIVGSALGVALGHLLAAYVVQRHGVDLGAGYSSGAATGLAPQWSAYAAYFGLGVVFSILGATPPALEVSRRAPGLAVRAGDEQDYARPRWHGLLGYAALAAGGVAALLPAWQGLPWAGYAAIALLLLGTVIILPGVATRVLRRVPAPEPVTAALAVFRTQAAPRQASVTVAAIVASLSLMVSMLVMIASFRASLDTWLEHMLPADAYLRSAPVGDTGFLTPPQQQLIATSPGIAAANFIRSQQIYLRADRPPLTLLARPVNRADASKSLVLQSRSIVPATGAPPPVWISEAVHDIYGWQVGDIAQIPLAGQQHDFTVAGIWRDYARQTGALMIEPDVYVALTGDRLANDVALWLSPGVGMAQAAAALRERLGEAVGYEISDTASLRNRSLAVFDRTFAVTYALEAVAILIGLMGVSASFSAQALARRREFGVLRHLGMTRSQIAAMLGSEGALLALFGTAVGLALGMVIGFILVHVVNRQSFHWSMDMHLPAGALAALSVVLVVSASLVAVWSGRYAMRDEAARAVREDW